MIDLEKSRCFPCLQTVAHSPLLQRVSGGVNKAIFIVPISSNPALNILSESIGQSKRSKAIEETKNISYKPFQYSIQDSYLPGIRNGVIGAILLDCHPEIIHMSEFFCRTTRIGHKRNCKATITENLIIGSLCRKKTNAICPTLKDSDVLRHIDT